MCSLILVRVVFTEIFEDESALVDEWLDQNDLSDFKKLFKEYGKYFDFIYIVVLKM